MAVLDSNEIFYTTFEPKVKNRFVMYIDGIPAFMVKKAKQPSFTDPVKRIEHINTYFNVRGKRKWEDASMELYDPITPSGMQAVMDWARLGYEAVTGRAGYQDFYKKDITMDILGPVGDIVSEWIYKGAWVSKVDPADLDWADEGEAITIPITITYDYAILNY
jgi:hypothetical protein